MFGTKYSKTNRLQKTIEYKKNKKSTKYSYWHVQMETLTGKGAFAVFASTKSVLNYIM